MQREITRELVRRLLPGRMAESNKGSYGSVLAAAGSMAYRGAAALCTEGALRGGAGLVYLASVEPVIQLVLSRTPECCACGCRTAANGGIHPQDADALRRWFADRHAVLLAGPGLGESAADVCKALLGRNAPWAGAVLDADALNALAAGKYRGDLPANTILTPHPGEAARLLGLTVPEVQADREGAAVSLAEKYHCAIILIGHMNKNSNGKSSYRGLGSIDFQAAARSVLIVGRIKEEPETRVVCHTKSSLAPEGKSIAFRLDKDNGFEWIGEYDISADELLNGDGKGQKSRKAKEFLLEILADGGMSQKKILEEAAKRGIKGKTLRNAKSELEVDSVKRGSQWYWMLPE